MRDRDIKGRGSAAKLNKREVLQIRKKYIPRRYTAKMLAEEYRVTILTIQRIVNNMTWKFVN